MSNRIGKKIQELRESKKMSQDELAELIGVTSSAISYYESGARRPRYEMLERIANTFDVEVNYILSIDEPLTVKRGKSKYEIMLEDRPELRRLLDICENTSKKDIEKVIKIINALR